MLAVAGTGLAAPARSGEGANRDVFLPAPGRAWHGVSDTGHLADYRRFNKQVRAHTPLLEVFFHWGVPLTTGALDRWERSDTRGVLSLSTAPGGEAEVITPQQIANGRDDHYLLRLNDSIEDSGQVVYIRPFAEMNLHVNPYSAFNADGSPRGGHATKWFRRAWRRLVLIVRGGKRDRINNRLLELNMPRIYRAKSNHDPIYRELEVRKTLDPPRVAFMWMPLTRGSPAVPGNAPRDYWPGRPYVDWVGTDTYAKFSNHTLWANLRRFYNHTKGYPFAIGEYGPWDNDFRGAFTRRIFRWAAKHRRVKALMYFRSVDPVNEFNLQFYPGARYSLRRMLNGHRWAPHAPGTKDKTEPPIDPPGGGGGGVTP